AEDRVASLGERFEQRPHLVRRAGEPMDQQDAAAVATEIAKCLDAERPHSFISTRGLCPLAPSGQARRGVVATEGPSPSSPSGKARRGPYSGLAFARPRAARAGSVRETRDRLARARAPRPGPGGAASLSLFV